METEVTDVETVTVGRKVKDWEMFIELVLPSASVQGRPAVMVYVPGLRYWWV